MKIMFVEPPKDFWFVMGEYLPPPLGILSLAAYLRDHDDSLELKIIDCQAERISWHELEEHIEQFQPNIVAPSSLATCNAYRGLRTIGMAKTIDPDITTIVGGQHYTELDKESLEAYPELDIVIRGEGEMTLLEVVRALQGKMSLTEVKGITFRHDGKIIETPDRPLIENLDDLPFPAYDLVGEYMKDYHFTMMAGRDTPYALVEAS
ncbi:MAG: B12-binding domain-containing radical SAM protein, partial [Promethearchaeota archaeon]